MSTLTPAADAALLVASRGDGADAGLYRFAAGTGGWQGKQLGRAVQLSALAPHPSLPCVYGTSGIGPGTLHAWRIDGDAAVKLADRPSDGREPCDLTVSPDGRLLVACNYASSTLCVQALDDQGRFDGPLSLLPLHGSGPDPDRQEAAHPHQAFFVDKALFVIDLGADLLRRFAYRPDRSGAGALEPVGESRLPAGTGPRHGVVLPDGRFAIGGELASTLAVGRPGDAGDDWRVIASTQRTGPAKTRHTRNYPGDVKRSASGRYVYLANRGHDTIATFDVSGDAPVFVSEHDTGAAWPQHMLVLDSHLLVAGWDSSQVVALPLTDERPGPAEPLFDCSGPGWLIKAP